MLCRLYNNADRIAKWLSSAYVVVFAVWSAGEIGSAFRPVAVVLQLLFILGLLVWRRQRQRVLPFVPDEILVCLPYFWGIANAGSSTAWFSTWQYPMIVICIVALPGMPDRSRIFVGGLRSNTLLQAIICAGVFTLTVATALAKLYPHFSPELYRVVLQNTALILTGVPISLAAFYEAVATSSEA